MYAIRQDAIDETIVKVNEINKIARKLVAQQLQETIDSLEKTGNRVPEFNKIAKHYKNLKKTILITDIKNISGDFVAELLESNLNDDKEATPTLISEIISFNYISEIFYNAGIKSHIEYLTSLKEIQEHYHKYSKNSLDMCVPLSKTPFINKADKLNSVVINMQEMRNHYIDSSIEELRELCVTRGKQLRILAHIEEIEEDMLDYVYSTLKGEEMEYEQKIVIAYFKILGGLLISFPKWLSTLEHLEDEIYLEDILFLFDVFSGKFFKIFAETSKNISKIPKKNYKDLRKMCKKKSREAKSEKPKDIIKSLESWEIQGKTKH